MILRPKSSRWLKWSIESALRRKSNIRSQIRSNTNPHTRRIPQCSDVFNYGRLKILLEYSFRTGLFIRHANHAEILRLEHWMHDATSDVSIWSKISNTSDNVSSGYPNTEKRVENTTSSGVFLTKFEVFGYPMKHCLECLIYLLNRNKN